MHCSLARGRGRGGVGHRAQTVAGGGGGEVGEGGFRGLDVVAGDGFGVGEAVGLAQQRGDLAVTPGVGGASCTCQSRAGSTLRQPLPGREGGCVRLPQQGRQARTLAGGRRAQGVDHGERQLALVDVAAKGFADFGLLAGEVEEVVDDLEGEAEGVAEVAEAADGGFIGGGVLGAEVAAGFDEGRGLAGDDVHVLALGEGEVAAAGDLHHLAFAHGDGGLADDAGGVLRLEAAAEVEGVAVEEIAHEDGVLVAPEAVDGGGAAADVGLVEDVVVDERGEVDELDDRSQHGVLGAHAAGGLGGEKQEGGAEHFAVELADVAAQVAGEGVVGDELVGEQAPGVLEVGGDGRVEVGEAEGFGLPVDAHGV